MQNYKQTAELEITRYLGTNTAIQFSLVPKEQSPRSQNTYQDEDGDISKRPGTIPVTTSALAAIIEYLSIYKSVPSAAGGEEIYAASGTTYYKFNGTSALTALTMTAPLNRADIHSVATTNTNLISVELLADGASLKKQDGTTVTLVASAVDDPSPAPPNGLTPINAKGIKFIWSHTNHVFVSPGTNEIFYSKKNEFDYFPTTFYFLLVRENDYVNGDGVDFDTVGLIPMRRSWAIITGKDFSDFEANTYLNTEHGVIAPRSIQKVTYSDGTQTIIFLSDNEVHEVFISAALGNSKIYATRSLMQGKINFAGLGLTEAEKSAAVGVFHPEKFLYLLSFQKAGVDYTYAYDTRNREWYTDWLSFNAKSYASLNGTLYFAGAKKHLQKFNVDLYTDWNETTKTTGTTVYYKRYSNAQSLEFSGFQSFWDAFLLESKQWFVPSTLDITFIFADITDVFPSIIANEVFVEGVSRFGFAKYVNASFTDLANEPNEILFEYSRLSKYMQVLVENNRDEPVKIIKEKWKGRVSGK